MRLFMTFALAISVFVLGCAKQPAPSDSAAETKTAETSPADGSVAQADGSNEAVENIVFEQPATLIFHVPEMMCPHGCYPGVKDALESQPNVVSVELGTPSEEESDEINDRRVVVKTTGSFDATKAVMAFPQHLQLEVDVEELPTGDEVNSGQPAS